MPKHKNTQSRQKTLYRVQNWSEYDKALVERGSITVWMSADFEKSWSYIGPSQRGGQFDYSEQAIKVMLLVKNVFHLSNRATEGFVRSLFTLLKVSLAAPDHTTLSRRGQTLKVKLPKKVSGHIDVVAFPLPRKVAFAGLVVVVDRQLAYMAGNRNRQPAAGVVIAE